MNFKCHDTDYVYCISCKDSILLTFIRSSDTYFKIYNFQIGYVLSLNSC
jgi:hypothetical protein